MEATSARIDNSNGFVEAIDAESVVVVCGVTFVDEASAAVRESASSGIPIAGRAVAERNSHRFGGRDSANSAASSKSRGMTVEMDRPYRRRRFVRLSILLRLRWKQVTARSAQNRSRPFPNRVNFTEYMCPTHFIHIVKSHCIYFVL